MTQLHYAGDSFMRLGCGFVRRYPRDVPNVSADVSVQRHSVAGFWVLHRRLDRVRNQPMQSRMARMQALVTQEAFTRHECISV